MKVQKRGGYLQEVKFDKITHRLKLLCVDLNDVDPVKIAQDAIRSIYDGISTEELDRISAKHAYFNKVIHPNYAILAARILESNSNATTPKTFSESMVVAHENGIPISESHVNFIVKNAKALDDMVSNSTGYRCDYCAWDLLESKYLLKYREQLINPNGDPICLLNGNVVTDSIVFTKSGNPIRKTATGIQSLKIATRARVVERPQYMYMRVAVALYKDCENPLVRIKECYDALSSGLFIHATPTLFNACMLKQQLASCFLLGVADSVEEIQKTLSDSSVISKWAGGIAIAYNNIRPEGIMIKGTGGESSGIVKQLKMFNDASVCWNQGGKRKGSFAIYLEPWHGDIMRFLQLKLQNGPEEQRARDLFYGLWVPDLFVKRLRAGQLWSLFSLTTAPGLNYVYDGMDVCAKCNFCENPYYAKYIQGPTGNCDHHDFKEVDVFTDLYTLYEEDGRMTQSLPAATIMEAICNAQRESGTPYICFKDHVNRMSNQKNIGTVQTSNLCTEIMEVCSNESYATCTLASVSLKMFIEDGAINHQKLHACTRLITRNLNRVLTVCEYPAKRCYNNVESCAPIGIGIQGLANVFQLLGLPFLSADAGKIDIEILETMYHAALTESCEIAKNTKPYALFMGSPASKGILHFDMWMANQKRIGGPYKNHNPTSGRYNWDLLRADIIKYGLANSLTIALMPTVSTASLMDNNESFEPIPSVIYTKTTIIGKTTIVNENLINELIKEGLWGTDMKNIIVNNKGSIQNITSIPTRIREIYKTTAELKQRDIMMRAALRGAFVDQSQSLNVTITKNTNEILTALFKNGWKLGLKTGSYYIRTIEAFSAFKNNISMLAVEPRVDISQAEESGETCQIGCTSCSG